MFLPNVCLTSVRRLQKVTIRHPVHQAPNVLFYFRCFEKFTDSTPPVAMPVANSSHAIPRKLCCHRIGLHSDKVCQ